MSLDSPSSHWMEVGREAFQNFLKFFISTIISTYPRSVPCPLVFRDMSPKPFQHAFLFTPIQTVKASQLSQSMANFFPPSIGQEKCLFACRELWENKRVLNSNFWSWFLRGGLLEGKRLNCILTYFLPAYLENFALIGSRIKNVLCQ